MEVGQQRDHADEARDGEDIDGGGGFLLYVYAPLGYVIGYCQGLSRASCVSGWL